MPDPATHPHLSIVANPSAPPRRQPQDYPVRMPCNHPVSAALQQVWLEMLFSIYR
jgi:hypothetical protein